MDGMTINHIVSIDHGSCECMRIRNLSIYDYMCLYIHILYTRICRFP